MWSRATNATTAAYGVSAASAHAYGTTGAEATHPRVHSHPQNAPGDALGGTRLADMEVWLVKGHAESTP